MHLRVSLIGSLIGISGAVSARAASILAGSILTIAGAADEAGEFRFDEVSASAGLVYEHGFPGGAGSEPRIISGGVAAGDLDGDGWIDLYAVRGTIGPNLLFRNRGDGTFEEIGQAAGLAVEGDIGSGPVFGDLDGDGHQDLLLGGIEEATVRLFVNRGDGTFEDRAPQWGVATSRDTFSMALGDYDRDGDLDVFMSHWGPPGTSAHLWRNDGGRLLDVGREAGISEAYVFRDFTFSPTFTDIDDDGWPDLLVASDFGTSKVWLNRRNGTFEDVTDPAVITDENGMGSAVGDYDGDGDLDWFVSSVWDPDGTPNGNWGVTGNRLYRNLGGGAFEDATDDAGVRIGYWGWGSCFADFDDDGDLDIFHVNGFSLPQASEFHEDPARLFVNDLADGGGGAFVERAAELGVADLGQGRGVVCFDYDRDGDLDIFVANNSGPPRLYRNRLRAPGQLPAAPHYLTVRLRDSRGGNTQGIGARIEVRTAAGPPQVREIRAGSNFASQNPAEAHFGLGDHSRIEELLVRWPDGREQRFEDVPADRLWVISAETLEPPGIPALGRGGPALLATLLLLAGGLRLRRP